MWLLTAVALAGAPTVDEVLGGPLAHPGCSVEHRTEMSILVCEDGSVTAAVVPPTTVDEVVGAMYPGLAPVRFDDAPCVAAGRKTTCAHGVVAPTDAFAIPYVAAVTRLRRKQVLVTACTGGSQTMAACAQILTDTPAMHPLAWCGRGAQDTIVCDGQIQLAASAVPETGSVEEAGQAFVEGSRRGQRAVGQEPQVAVTELPGAPHAWTLTGGTTPFSLVAATGTPTASVVWTCTGPEDAEPACRARLASVLRDGQPAWLPVLALAPRVPSVVEVLGHDLPEPVDCQMVDNHGRSMVVCPDGSITVGVVPPTMTIDGARELLRGDGVAVDGTPTEVPCTVLGNDGRCLVGRASVQGTEADYRIALAPRGGVKILVLGFYAGPVGAAACDQLVTLTPE